MATATIPQVWVGRSGREYIPVPKSRVRHGGMASVRKVMGRGGPVGISSVEDGVPLALKLWLEGDETSLDQLQREARILVDISSLGEDIPCPRLFDLVGKPLVTGVVMEWCPVDLERWWRGKMLEEDAVGRLMFTLAEAARRVGELHACFRKSDNIEAAHGDLKPTNVVLSTRGRWLVADFGTTQRLPQEDDLWAESRVIVASNNFVAPEVLFNARNPHPAATDIWSLAASLFALLRLKKLSADRGMIPRNGTHSPRFRMERMNRVVEIYGHDPSRFLDRDLNPGDFMEPTRIPDDDRRALQDSLRGCFGDDAGTKEEQFSGALLEVMDRAMAIDPAARYPVCEALAEGFQQLGRLYIELSATQTPAPARGISEEAVRAKEAALNHAAALQAEVHRLTAQLQEAQRGIEEPPARESAPEIERSAPIEPPVPAWRPPLWWSMALIASLVLQLAILVLVLLQSVLSWTL